MGILSRWNLSPIIEQARVPVMGDAGVGTAFDVAIAIEVGCDGVLMNAAIAHGRERMRMPRRRPRRRRGGVHEQTSG